MIALKSSWRISVAIISAYAALSFCLSFCHQSATRNSLSAVCFRTAGAAWARAVESPLDRFEAEVKRFELSDKDGMPPPGGTLFIGSSTFAHWKTLEAEFKDCGALNRGFGGSTVPEVNYYAERIAIKYNPARVVFYAGTNDIAEGHSAQRVCNDFRAFVEKLHRALPTTQIYFISMSVPPCRMEFLETYNEGNRLVKEFVHEQPFLHYIDITPAMHDASGKLRDDYFGPDRLHMNRSGYDAWVPIIRQAL